jgi:hypothetical protein
MATRLTPKTVASEPPPKDRIARAEPALEVARDRRLEHWGVGADDPDLDPHPER